MPHSYTDTRGNVHQLPAINERIRRRLRDWMICDLLAVINQPSEWSRLFERLGNDGEYIINFAYALEHDQRGADFQQLEFGNLLVGGEAGSGPLLECSRALQQAVIDFFPVDRRESIRQFYQMSLASSMAAQLEKMARRNPDSRFTGSDFPTPRNGSTP